MKSEMNNNNTHTRRQSAIALAVIGLVFIFASLAQAATFHVTTATDNGNNNSPTAGSLRKAIIDANANPGTDTIDFSIAGAGVHTISLLSGLPTITDPVVIDGYTQPGASMNTIASGDNAVLLIEITGTNPFNFSLSNGLLISAGSSTVRGLIINGFGGNNLNSTASGIRLTTKGLNVISGNFIGTNSSGTAKIPNDYGVVIDGCDNNIIGGNVAQRNIISGNAEHGIAVVNSGADNNTISGNFIGTDRNGTAALGNGSTGIEIAKIGLAASAGEIGGTLPGRGNVISGNGTEGIQAFGNVSNLLIQGNLIGTDVTGKAALGNGGNGVDVSTSVGSLVVIGGAGAAGRNIISANKYYGIGIGTTGVVQGNYIGTDITGKAALGNGASGMGIFDSSNSVGGVGAGEGNVISGNAQGGVYIAASSNGAGNNNMVLGNLIGYGADGVTPLGNAGNGVWINSGSNNTIGGTAFGAGNVIAFNSGAGVMVSVGVANLVSSNSITSNGGLGIDLQSVGVTPNDLGDADTGPNNLQNYPVLSRAALISNGLTYISGTLNSTASTKFHIELFANSAPDPSGFGEGQTFIGGFDVTTDSNGNASFNNGGYLNLSLGQYISATATDPALNTSEFSQVKQVAADGPGSLQFSSAAYSVNENGGQATITVKRTGGSFGTDTLHYATIAGGTATAGTDYTAVSGTLTWGDFDSSDKTFTVPVIDNSVKGPDKTVNLALSNPTNGATLGSPNTAVLTIKDDESLPQLSISDVSQAEGNSGTTSFVFNVSLSAASSQTSTVNYATQDGSAQSGSDYQPASGILTFAPGETSKPITVLVNGDTQVEPDETFTVQLSNPSNATLSKAQSVGTILNDDVAPPTSTVQIEQASYTVSEGAHFKQINITRTGDTSQPASVDYATSDGSAHQQTDYTIALGTLQFASGESSKTVHCSSRTTPLWKAMRPSI